MINVRIKNKQVISIIFATVLFFLACAFPFILFGSATQPLWVHLLWMTMLVFWFMDSYFSQKTIKNLLLDEVRHESFHLGERGRVVLKFNVKKAYPMAWVSGGVKSSTTKNIMKKDGADGEVETWRLTDEKANINLFIEGDKRGWNTYPEIVLSTTYPIGITKTMKTIKIENRFLVYPEIEKDAPDIPKNTSKPVMKKSIDGDEVLMWRDYKDGDRLSSIDWKKTAKSNEIVVKEYMSDEDDFYLDWEMVSHLEKERAISRLTAWIKKLHKTNASWSLKLNNIYIESGNGDKHLHKCLVELALL